MRMSGVNQGHGSFDSIEDFLGCKMINVTECIKGWIRIKGIM